MEMSVLEPINKLIKQCARILLNKASRQASVIGELLNTLKWLFVEALHKL